MTILLKACVECKIQHPFIDQDISSCNTEIVSCVVLGLDYNGTDDHTCKYSFN